MHTKEPWIAVSGDEEEVGYARQWPVVTSLDGEVEIIGTEGFYSELELSKANARRVVACVNACAGIPTEKLEGKTINEYVASEAFLTGMTTEGELNIGIKGLACQMLAESFAGQFVGNGATNSLEVGMTSEKTGPMIVTIQRVEGKTPAQQREEMKQERDELLSTLKLLHSAEWMVSNDCNESRAQIVERVEEVLAKYGE